MHDTSGNGLVFYIAHYCSDEQTALLLGYCIRGISEQYPDADIIICKSSSEYVQNTRIELPDKAKIIDSPVPNSSCVGCFKDFLIRYRGCGRKAVFIHDSMILKDKLNNDILQRPFGFMWYFRDTNLATSIMNIQMRSDYYKMLAIHNMDYEDTVGCFGFSCFGTYESIEKLWEELPFEEYMKIQPRREVMMDLERFVGVAASYLGLITSIETCSLCGNIFDFPFAFKEWYTNQSYEEISAISYEQPMIKIWKQRWS